MGRVDTTSAREMNSITRFDPGDPSQRRYMAYAGAKFPDARDSEIDEFVAGLRNGGPGSVQAAVSRVTDKGRQVLAAYAERAASRAVRDNDPERLTHGLVALVVGGLDQNTLEALLRMPVLEDAARRLDVEPAEVFEKAAAVVGHPGSVNLMVWLARPAEDRTLGSMGFEPGRDESGFRYKWSG